jgi:hypothetical protein
MTVRPPTSESAEIEHYLDLPLARREKEIKLESWLRAVGHAHSVGVPFDAQASALRINDGSWVARFFWTTTHLLPGDDSLPLLDAEQGHEILVPGRVIVRVASGTWEVRDPRITRLDPQMEPGAEIHA